MKRDRLSFIAGAAITLFVAISAILAIVAATKMNTTGPVAPTVPQVRPHAEEPQPTTPACKLAFTIAPSPRPKCDSITLDPSTTTVAEGSTRKLTVSGSGGTGDISFTWEASGGNLSTNTGKIVTWTAPSNLTSDQSWTIKANVKDSAGQTAQDACAVTLNFKIVRVCNSQCSVKEECPSGMTCAGGNCRNLSCITETSCVCPPPTPPTPPPPPTPPTPTTPVCNSTCTTSANCPNDMACSNGRCRNPSCTTVASCVCPAPVGTHLECLNRACVIVNGAGQDTCTSDVSCQPAATPPPIPKSGVDLPTIGLIVGGLATLVIAGLLVL